MGYLGELSQNSTILLELMTKAENDKPIQVDFPPTATIGQHDANGVQTVDSVTLITVDNGSRHTYSYTIPSHWKAGNYRITYHVIIDGSMHETDETFTLKQESIPIRMMAETVPPVIEDSSYEATDILPQDFQIESLDPIVEGNTITLKPKTTLLVNHTYTVVLKGEIASVTGSTLNTDKQIQFTTTYSPLYATPLEVRSVLKQTFSQFTLHDIYVALRDAGEKAHTLKRMVANAENNRFRLIQERDASYFPATKYVQFEAARQLLSGLYLQMISNQGPNDGSSSLLTSGGKFTLGDLSVEDSSSSAGTGQTDSVASAIKVIQNILKEVESELKFWRDSMMGYNAKGYGKPISAITRSNAVGPESRDF